MTTGAVTRLIVDGQANSCYFRTAAGGDGRKALLQITERCNLHCAHCFVSSTQHGGDMDARDIRNLILPRLRRARVERVTLTGGEPFVHPDILEICSAGAEARMSVGICTNATCVTDEQMDRLLELGNVHVNVSFDGFRRESHGRFRGSPASFDVTVETTRRLAARGLLQGLLSTPNALTTTDDYRALAEFAIAVGAEYLLMNPLSAFGRGIRSRRRLAAAASTMREIRRAVEDVAGDRFEVVPIRFPSSGEQPLAPCIAGSIVYVFVDGAVAACPYLVFAARSHESRYAADEFVLGNVLTEDIADRLDAYRFHDRYQVGANPVCGSCRLNDSCGKGCPAAVVADGGLIGDRDRDPCPF